MAIRLFVHAPKLRATVEHSSPRVVAPAFRKATVTIDRPAYQTVVSFSDPNAITAYRNLVSSVNYLSPNTVSLVLDPDTKNRYFRGDNGESFGVLEQAARSVTKRRRGGDRCTKSRLQRGQ